MAAKKVQSDVLYLFDLLTAGPQTYQTVEAELGWDRGRFYKVVQGLRDFCAENDDTITVLNEPQGGNAPHLYTLTAGNYVGESAWAGNRISDLRRRLDTFLSVAKVAVNATDGRTNDGKAARILEFRIRQAKEEIKLLASR